MRSQRAVPRDVLPLPFLESEASSGVGGRSRVRRRCRRAHVREWANETIAALNEMHAGRSDVKPSGLRPSLVQHMSLERIRRAVEALGPPPAGVTRQGALSELLARHGYDGKCVTAVPLDLSRISLPEAGTRPVPLASLFGRSDKKLIKDFIRDKVLSTENAARKLEETGLRAPYMDPGLRRDQRRYGELLRRMDACGMISWSLSGQVSAGLFAVKKKADRQRLIVEARVANTHLGPPDSVSLATGAALGSVEVDAGAPFVALAG